MDLTPEVHREWLTNQLRNLLRALASPGEVALSYEPDETCRADELALDYDNFVHALIGNFGVECTAEQRASLLRVDELFDAMTKARQPELWTDEAVRSHPRWAEVRAAAQTALDAMWWNPRPFTCPCCGFRTLAEAPGSYEICHVCFWQDDGVQLLDPAYNGGANTLSLMECQANYERIGACEERFLDSVQPPSPGEKRDAEWRPAKESDLDHAPTPQVPTVDSWYYWKRRST